METTATDKADDMDTSRSPIRASLAHTGLLISAMLLFAAPGSRGQDLAGQGASGCQRAPACLSKQVPGRTAEQALGERLFEETRFSRYFMLNSGGNVNARLRTGEPIVATELTDQGTTLPGPMRRESMNCMQCHLGRQESQAPGGGMRSFADFATRSPIPPRSEDLVHGGFTPRNSTNIAGDDLHGDVDPMLHWDAQFGSMQELVAGTLPGRVFGWLATEKAQSQKQVADVIRGDNGKDTLAREFSAGVSYAALFGCSPRVPAGYQLPSQDCLDLGNATDAQIVNSVAAVMAAYLNTLDYSRDASGQHDGSPYDRFLIKNRLPRAPAPGQTPADYAAALLTSLESLASPRFVEGGHFKYHDRQPFRFGPAELHGLITFLSKPANGTITSQEAAQGGIGNCVSCHMPPEFSDFKMHNNGVAQAEYDSIHGQGSFAQLTVPTLDERNADPDAYLPVTGGHPDATETFRLAPSASAPGHTDLGVWNIFANPDFASRQASLRKFLCAIDSGQFADCGASDAVLLDRSLGVFRTHNLRDLGDSDPYMHTGQFQTLDAVVRFYEATGVLARAGQLRNGDPQMSNVALTDQDVADLTAFLASLNEDYVGN